MDEPLGESTDNLLSLLDRCQDQNFEKELVEKITLDKAKDRLTNRERMIVTLRYEYGLSQSEIAQRLAVSQMHVSRLLRRSLEKMAKSIDPVNRMLSPTPHESSETGFD